MRKTFEFKIAWRRDEPKVLCQWKSASVIKRECVCTYVYARCFWSVSVSISVNCPWNINSTIMRRNLRIFRSFANEICGRRVKCHTFVQDKGCTIWIINAVVLCLWPFYHLIASDAPVRSKYNGKKKRKRHNPAYSALKGHFLWPNYGHEIVTHWGLAAFALVFVHSL